MWSMNFGSETETQKTVKNLLDNPGERWIIQIN